MSARSLATAFLAAAALLAPGAAHADLSFGVTDDYGKYADDGGGNFFADLAGMGGNENRMTVLWDPTDGNRGFTIRDGAFLDRAIPIASLRGIRVVLSVYPAQAKAFTVDTQNRISLFAQFLQLLARTYPTVDTFIVGNEPNQPRFLQPQFVRDGHGGYRPVAAATFEHVLAAAYDALKAVDPKITVVGVGLSPRGNDNPRAKSNVSRSPVRFIADLAAEYRRSGRDRPIMDELGFHPYPQSNDDPFSRGYSWPNAGLQNLDRIKQAFWDGFHGTAQPTFVEGDGTKGGAHQVTFDLDEYGRQVRIISSVRRLYTGRENVRTVTEQQQANLYVSALRLAQCDPGVSHLLFFHLVDETDLDRFQSGLLRADGTKRPAYDAVRAALAASGGRCTSGLRAWYPTTLVVGGDVTFADAGGTATVTAGEDVLVAGSIFPASMPTAAIREALVRRHSVPVSAYRSRSVSFGRAGLRAGTYVEAVLVRAAVNPERTLLATSDPFTVP